MRRYHDSTYDNTLCQDQFARRIAPLMNMTNQQATDVLNVIRKELRKCILEGYGVKIERVGVIGTKFRRGRKMPPTTLFDEYQTPDRQVVYLRPSKQLNEELRERGLLNEKQNS